MAMFQSGTYNLAAIAEQARFRWGVVMLPDGPKGRVSVTNGIAAAGNSATEHPDAVRQVLAWMGSTRGNEFLGARGAAIPAVLAAQPVYFDYWRCTRGRRVTVLPGARRPAHPRARRRRLRRRLPGAQAVLRRDVPRPRRCRAQPWPTPRPRRTPPPALSRCRGRLIAAAAEHREFEHQRRTAHPRAPPRTRPSRDGSGRDGAAEIWPAPPRAVIASPISSARRSATVIAAASRSITSMRQRRRRARRRRQPLAGPQAARRVQDAELVDQHREGPQRQRESRPPSRRPGPAAPAAAARVSRPRARCRRRWWSTTPCAPSPSSTIDSAVIRRKLSSPPSPTSIEPEVDDRAAAGEGGGQPRRRTAGSTASTESTAAPRAAPGPAARATSTSTPTAAIGTQPG